MRGVTGGTGARGRILYNAPASMADRVTLKVSAGPLAGRVFSYDRHDTFLFGRSPDCHAELAATDTTASRHHFLRFLIKSYLLSRMYGSVSHDGGDRMTVARFNRPVGLFTAANTFHPVTNMIGCKRVAACISRSYHFLYFG